jgi:transposase
LREWSQHEEVPEVFPEVVERAVRMVFDDKDQYPSQWAAIESIAGKIGCTAETLRRWVRQGERDSGIREGPTTAEQQRVKELEREVRELRRANEMLKLASAFFAQAELDRRVK